MNTINEHAAKRNYIKPHIEIIRIDFEISLQITSPGSQPEGDPLGSNDYLNKDHFKVNIG